MILLLLGVLVAEFVFGTRFSSDALLVAFALGLIADAVRSNRVSQKEAAVAFIKSFAETLGSKKDGAA